VAVIFITVYVLRFIHFVFRALEKGTIQFSWFYPEWADSTYKIVRILVIAFAVAFVFPYIPGSRSPAFRYISLFLGVVASLGSSSAIANLFAGVVLVYTRAFQIGDRVKIGDTMGDVMERSLLVTRLRTIKNEYITIPNSIALGSHVTNYSFCQEKPGLILHTSATIGYDAPWRKVHELLVSAAAATKLILSEPPPFVFQTSLNDFYVTYQLNAYTEHPHQMQGIYAELHANIQDKFNEAGVEICSPHFFAARDANRIAIPDSYIPDSYTAPAFRVVSGVPDPRPARAEG
jgi:small-conductance mechanosensitive channel